MHIHVFPDEQQLARALATRIADHIRREPATVLGLPTGRTPVLLYAELARLAGMGALDLSGASTFNLDEVLGR